MNKKTISKGVKNTYRPIAVIYGLGILLALIFYLLDFYGGSGLVVGSVLNVICMVSFWAFGLFSLYVLVPIVAVLALIIVGIVYAISERNIKNIFNFPLWGTVALVVLNTLLQFEVMSNMF